MPRPSLDLDAYREEVSRRYQEGQNETQIAQALQEKTGLRASHRTLNRRLRAWGVEPHLKRSDVPRSQRRRRNNQGGTNVNTINSILNDPISNEGNAQSSHSKESNRQAPLGVVDSAISYLGGDGSLDHIASELNIPCDSEIMWRLVKRALFILHKFPRTDQPCVVAGALTKDKKILTGFNVHHFAGGACAESVVMGSAAAQGFLPKDITHIVAVSDRNDSVLNPCGRCRQMFIDLCPDIRVVVRDDQAVLKIVSARELLPFAFIAKP